MLNLINAIVKEFTDFIISRKQLLAAGHGRHFFADILGLGVSGTRNVLIRAREFLFISLYGAEHCSYSELTHAM